MVPTLRARIYDLLDDETPGNASKPLNWFMMTLVVANVATMVLETVARFRSDYAELLRLLDLVSLMVFSAEYLLRVWSCTASERYRHPVTGRLKLMLSPMTLIDLVALVPMIMPLLGLDPNYTRFFRLLKLAQLTKFFRYSHALATFSRIFHKTRDVLVVCMSFLGFLLLASSSLIYFAENAAQPDRFTSIPASMWWAIVTMSTLGYGDVYPVTTIGKVVGGLTSSMGIILYALPTAVLGAAFVEEWLTHKAQKQGDGCPHCGK